MTELEKFEMESILLRMYFQSKGIAGVTAKKIAEQVDWNDEEVERMLEKVGMPNRR
jgi:hypothetical protein